jgi:hypothetical protein
LVKKSSWNQETEAMAVGHVLWEWMVSRIVKMDVMPLPKVVMEATVGMLGP